MIKCNVFSGYELLLLVPSFFSRATMQALWALGQQQLFAISSRKE
jgi:hypothetical protein